MSRFSQRVAMRYVKLVIINIMQKHIYTTKVISRNVDFLSEKPLSDIP